MIASETESKYLVMPPSADSEDKGWRIPLGKLKLWFP